MTIELTEAQRKVLRSELKRLVLVYDGIMENTPTTKTADIANTLMDILDKLEPPTGVINE